MSKYKGLLEKYIQTHGQRLETHLPDFYKGGNKESLCIFCEDTHDKNRVYILFGEIHKSIDTGVFACNMCENEIDEMIEVVYFFSKQEIDNIIPIEKIENGIYENDDDDIDELFDPNKQIGYDKEERSLQLQIEAKLYNINTKYSFPHNIHEYYLHLHEGIDRYAKVATCCTCDRIINVSSAMTLDVPVYSNETMTGGKVAICNDCELYLPDIKKTIEQLLKEATLFKEICQTSRKSYLVEANEHMARMDYNTPKGEMPPEYLCPEIAYKCTTMGEWANIFACPENMSARDLPPDRFVTLKGLCDCKFTVDLTMNPAYVNVFHRINNKGSEYAVCQRCRVYRDLLNDEATNIIQQDGGGVFLLCANQVDWSGVVKQLDSGRLLDLFEEEESSSVEEFIAKAINTYAGQNSNSDK